MYKMSVENLNNNHFSRCFRLMIVERAKIYQNDTSSSTCKCLAIN